MSPSLICLKDFSLQWSQKFLSHVWDKTWLFSIQSELEIRREVRREMEEEEEEEKEE